MLRGFLHLKEDLRAAQITIELIELCWLLFTFSPPKESYAQAYITECVFIANKFPDFYSEIMDINIIRHNIELLARSDVGQHFAVEGDKLVEADNSDPRVQEIIAKTFEEAARLEKTPSRVWVHIDGGDWSVGHAIMKSAELQRIVKTQFADEKREFTTLVVGGKKYDHFDISILKIRSSVIGNLLADFEDTPQEIPLKFEWDPKPTKREIGEVMLFLQGNDNLRSELTTQELTSILKGANYLGMPSLEDACIARLSALPSSEKRQIIPLLEDVHAEKLLATISKEELVQFFRDTSRDPSAIKPHTLINKGMIAVTDFDGPSEVRDLVDLENITYLNVSEWIVRKHDVGSFERTDDNRWGKDDNSNLKGLLRGCPNVETLILPQSTTDDVFESIPHPEKLTHLDLSACRVKRTQHAERRITEDATYSFLKRCTNLRELKLFDGADIQRVPRNNKLTVKILRIRWG